MKRPLRTSGWKQTSRLWETGRPITITRDRFLLTMPIRLVKNQLRWNAAEDKNVQEKDMGAVKGTNLRDLCDLAGGMSPGDLVKLKAEDGFTKTFAYENVYTPSARQGPMVIAWYHDAEGYVPQYRTGMRLIFFADNSTNPWGIHVLGNNDWQRICCTRILVLLPGRGMRNTRQPPGCRCSTISDILIYSRSPVQEVTVQPTTPITTPASASLSPYSLLCVLIACVFLEGQYSQEGMKIHTGSYYANYFPKKLRKEIRLILYLIALVLLCGLVVVASAAPTSYSPGG